MNKDFFLEQQEMMVLLQNSDMSINKVMWKTNSWDLIQQQRRIGMDNRLSTINISDLKSLTHRVFHHQDLWVWAWNIGGNQPTIKLT